MKKHTKPEKKKNKLKQGRTIKLKPKEKENKR